MTTKSYNEHMSILHDQSHKAEINVDISSLSFVNSIKHLDWFIKILLICHILFLSHSHMSMRVLYNIYFVFFIWLPIGNKLARTTGQSKYIFYALFNHLVLSCIYRLLKYPISRHRFIGITPFALFETLLYMSVNKEQTTSICFFRIRNKYCKYLIFIATFIFNRWLVFWLFIPFYSFVFHKRIVKSLSNFHEIKIARFEQLFNDLTVVLEILIEELDRELKQKNVHKSNSKYIEDINSISQQQLKSHLQNQNRK